jgi:hypothetical protein
MLGASDPTVKYIQAKIEEELRRSPFVKQLQPLTWFKAVDLLQEQQRKHDRSFLAYSDVQTLCAGCGIESQHELPLLLEYLNEMGTVFWLNEDTLRDFVILDVVAAFVKPVTILICKHEASSVTDYERLHVKTIHKQCQKRHGDDWLCLMQKGIVSDSLLRALLGDYVSTYEVIVKLMLKYALLVEIQTFDAADATGGVKNFLVPSLLPLTAAPQSQDVSRGEAAESLVLAFCKSKHTSP